MRTFKNYWKYFLLMLLYVYATVLWAPKASYHILKISKKHFCLKFTNGEFQQVVCWVHMYCSPVISCVWLFEPMGSSIFSREVYRSLFTSLRDYQGSPPASRDHFPFKCKKWKPSEFTELINRSNILYRNHVSWKLK